jgi:hypothetical protein
VLEPLIAVFDTPKVRAMAVNASPPHAVQLRRAVDRFCASAD